MSYYGTSWGRDPDTRVDTVAIFRWIAVLAAIGAVAVLFMFRQGADPGEPWPPFTHMLGGWLVFFVGLCISPPVWILAYIAARVEHFFRYKEWKNPT